MANSNPVIGTLNEWSLHSSLKEYYQLPGDQLEATVDGYVIDILRENLLLEVQTSNFISMKKKLQRLLPKYRIRLIHPIAEKRIIIRESLDGCEVLSKRKSPKRGSYVNLFEELVFIPFLAKHENFSLEIAITHEIERKRRDGKGSWRNKGWSIVDRELDSVIETRLFEKPHDYLSLIPEINEPFTNADLARSLDVPNYIARKMTYSLRKMNVLQKVGMRGRAPTFLQYK